MSRWSGAVAVTPDNLPILSGVDEIPGLFIAAAGGYGITWAPAIGEIMAQIALGQSPAVDIGAFDLGRFRKTRASSKTA